MKDKNQPAGYKGARGFSPRILGRLWCWVLALALVSACAGKTPATPPAEWPSRVFTRDGVMFTVERFRLPGTTQELIIKIGEARQWIPLNLISLISFYGPLKEGYRAAEIMLISGEKFKGEVFVGVLVEGTTDVGYWNIPFAQVERLDMGTD